MTATNTKTQRGELTKYFRDYFANNPDQLTERGNTAILERYRQDFNLSEGFEIPKNIVANLNNLKTTLKKNGSNGHSTAVKRSKTNGTNGSIHGRSGTTTTKTSSSTTSNKTTLTSHLNQNQDTLTSYLNQIQSAVDSIKKMVA